MSRALVLLGPLYLASCVTATSPELTRFDLTEEMRSFWRMGQQDVACLVNPWGEQDRIEAFELREHRTLFSCADEPETAGCFRSPNEIHFTRGHEYVLRHEATHAILHRHKHRCWKSIGHEGGCKPCYEYACVTRGVWLGGCC